MFSLDLLLISFYIDIFASKFCINFLLKLRCSQVIPTWRTRLHVVFWVSRAVPSLGGSLQFHPGTVAGL